MSLPTVFMQNINPLFPNAGSGDGRTDFNLILWKVCTANQNFLLNIRYNASFQDRVNYMIHKMTLSDLNTTYHHKTFYSTH